MAPRKAAPKATTPDTKAPAKAGPKGFILDSRGNYVDRYFEDFQTIIAIGGRWLGPADDSAT